LIIMDFFTRVQIYKNYGGQQVFVWRVQTELINSVYRLENFPAFSLTFIPLWNSISSLILRVSVWMSPRSESNLCSSPWSTSDPKWSFDGFAMRISISLSHNNSFKSVFLDSFDYFEIRRYLEDVSNMKSVTNLISYLHENSWIFISLLAILFNFLNSKTDPRFPNF
jgi:hypothetical protein